LSTIYDILEDYPTVNNITELMDSDILILPNKKKEGSFGQYQPLELANINKDLKIKYYCDGEPSIRFEASTELDIGLIVVPVVTNLVVMVISDYIIKHHKTDDVKSTIIHGNFNNCQINVFEGNGSDVSREILKLKDNYK
jgi:hypothetical protein